jgi:hypothetical protein
VGTEELLVVLAGVRAALVGVIKQAVAGAPTSNGGLQRSDHEMSTLTALNDHPTTNLECRSRIAARNKRPPSPTNSSVVSPSARHQRAIPSSAFSAAMNARHSYHAAYCVKRPRGRAADVHAPELSSKGAISLAVASWHLALMEYALKSESSSQFPCLLMLDSPLSHVGRDTSDPEFRDQKLVDGFYAVLARLHERRDRFQILICDNRPPVAAREMVSVEFTGDPTVGRYGLVDDEHPPLP